MDGSWLAGGHTYPVLAMAYHRLGRKEKAREALQKAERLIDQWSNDFLRVPAWSTAMPWFNWMACYLLYREAETLINGVAPADDPRMYVARARSFAALKNQTKVDEACARAVELGPENGAVRLECARVYSTLGQWEKVVADLSDTKGRVSDKKLLPDVYFLRALANAQLDRFADALADYDKTVELAPESALALNNSAWLLATCADAKFRDPARAVRLAKKAVQLAAKEGTLWNTLGVARYRAGEWQSAIDAIKKSMELRSGGDSFDWFCLAMAHWQLAKTGVSGPGSGAKEEKPQHRAEARKWYDQAVMWMEKNNPKDEELRRFRTEAAELMDIEKTKTPTTKDTKSTSKKPS